MIRRKGTADPDQANARMRPAQRGDDTQQHVDALARNGAADVQQLNLPATGGTEKRVGLFIRVRLRSRSERGMHAVRHNNDAVRRNDSRRDQPVARGGLPHRILRATFIPSRSRLPSARWTIEPREIPEARRETRPDHGS